jgi:transglutaminase superfamily protein/transglutaminase TgpA-like protein
MEIRKWRHGPLAIISVIVLVPVACESGGTVRGTEAGQTAESVADAPLFEVETTDPDYWRLYTLDRFDGSKWWPTGSDGLARPMPAVLPGLDPAAPGVELTQQSFRILSDLDWRDALPIPPMARSIEGPAEALSWDPLGSRAFIDGGLREGMQYTVRSAVIVPRSDQLEGAEAQPSAGRWVQLPADLDPHIREIAERWTADATSDYRKVLAIQDRFQMDDFGYSTAVPIPDSPDALLEFITESKVGYCEHYSSAMAVLLRSLGIPARIAAGFREGTLQEDGSYLVRPSDVHVWVEVRFAGFGWLPFEPEHGATHPNAAAGTYLNP